ncbi:MAG TPA: TonB-dependent receptor, partial [Puia sp.]|nr:TonB-dependent receptor [Puia sp.]
MRRFLFLFFGLMGFWVTVVAHAQKDAVARGQGSRKDTVPGVMPKKDSMPGLRLPKDSVPAKVSVLGQVTVTGKRPLTEQKIDRLVINVDAAVTNAGATALEVLEKAPGVTVDKDGHISLKGKQGVLLMMDGKPTYLSGTDLSNLLSSMNANQLDQIEIMTNPPAKYDAAGNSGIINIKTKKNRPRGFNGSFTVGYAQGKYWKTNSSLNLNYRNGSYNLFMNYSFSENRGFTDLHILRRYLATDGKTVNSIFDEPTYLNRKIANNNLKLGMDYFLSSRTTLGVVATGFISPRIFDGFSSGYLQDGLGHTDSTTYTSSLNNSRVVNGAVNLNFRHSFDSTHELTADADYIRYKSTNPQLYGNTTYYPDGTLASSNQLKGDLPSTIDIWSGKMDYSQALKKGLKLEGGWKSSLVETRNAANYFNLSGGNWVPDYGKTNDFNYRENINALYLNLNREIGKWSFQGGLRYENTNYTGHQTGNPQKPDSSFTHQYNSLFPTGFVSWQADKNDQFTLSAGRRIDRPAYQDLNPFLFFINQYTYNQGNPFLRPQYTTNLELSHIFKGVLTTTLNYSNTEAYFTDLFRTVGDTTIFSRGNLGRLRNAGLSVN